MYVYYIHTYNMHLVLNDIYLSSNYSHLNLSIAYLFKSIRCENDYTMREYAQ